MCRYYADDKPESWSECPENITVYEGCQYTIHALFNSTAANRSCTRSKNGYSYSVVINSKSTEIEDVNVVLVNGSESTMICNVFVSFIVEDIDHSVTFIAARTFPFTSNTTRIDCNDVLLIYSKSMHVTLLVII